MLIKYISHNRIHFSLLCIFQMSGLDINTSQILEIACVITDKNLKTVSKDLNIVIHQSDEILNNMNDWCLATHQKVILYDINK